MAGPTSSRRVRLDWIVGDSQTEAASFRSSGTDLPTQAMLRDGIAEHLRANGFLASVPEIPPKEELLALLRVAVEVEHALLVQYLYAAASVPSGPVGDSIRDIAIQEMGHFITVENLLLAVGGPTEFHIGRDVDRTTSAFNPLPFDLERVSRLSLAEFVLAERPEPIPPALETQVRDLQRLVVGKAGYQPVRVGALYAKIYWLLQPTDDPFGPLALTANPRIGFDPGRHIGPDEFAPAAAVADHVAKPDEWRSSSGPDMRIHPVTDAHTAVGALYSVMGQGEGPASAQDSHFNQFLVAFNRFEQGAVTVLPLPTNPYVGHPPIGVTSGVPIHHEYVRLWANLLNVRYTGLLLAIGHAMLTPGSNPDRGALIGFIFDVLMGRNFGSLIGFMTAPTMRGFDQNSAPTFELLREDMPTTLRDCWVRHAELLDSEARIREELRARAELAADVDGTTLLDRLERSWQDLRDWTDLRLAAQPQT